jgi:hypothetical protein
MEEDDGAETGRLALRCRAGIAIDGPDAEPVDLHERLALGRRGAAGGASSEEYQP